MLSNRPELRSQPAHRPDGSLRAVNPDRDPGVGTPGVASLRLDAYGGFLQFNDVDFGQGGASLFHVEVGSEVAEVKNAALEVRLDNPAGQVIASLAIDRGKGKTAYRVLSGGADSRVHGVHDLCL